MASRAQTEQQQQSQDIGELLADLAIKIDRLKTLYEQYFMGIEKMEPQVARKEVTRAMLLLQQQYIRNTALRFKFNTMLQKWNIYITYWNRILREIENGTYTRHLAKARRKAEQAGRELPQEIAAAAAKKMSRQSGTFDAIEDTSESAPRFLDNETGAQSAYLGSTNDAELEQVWDRITGADPKRRPPPTPPPGTLAAILPAALTGRDKMLAELAAAKVKAQADLDARRGSVPAPIGKQGSGPTPSALPPPPPFAANRAGNSVPIAIDKDKSGPIPRAALPPPPPPPGQQRAAAAPPRLPPPPPAQLPKIPGMNEPELRALHQRYVDAQKQSGAGAGVKYETLVNSLAKQVPSVLKQPGVKGVRFDVSVQDGRPVLKAIPQK